MAVNINKLNAGNMTLTTGGSAPAEPSPYFEYDENRNIVGVKYVEYVENGIENGYWPIIGQQSVVDNYALGIKSCYNNCADGIDIQSLSCPNARTICADEQGGGGFYTQVFSLPSVTTIENNALSSYGWDELYLTSFSKSTVLDNLEDWGISMMTGGETIHCSDGTLVYDESEGWTEQ